MTRDDYLELKKETRGLKRSTLQSWRWVLQASAVTAASVALSLSDNVGVWLIGQLLYVVSVFNWFSLVHDAGHGVFFESKLANEILGYVGSICMFMPFEQWKATHREHHRWTGYFDKDPTTEARARGEMKPAAKRIVDVAWKYWIPLFGLSFQIGTFWNPFATFKFAKSRGDKFRQLLSLVAFAGPRIALGFVMGAASLKLWLLGFVLQLFTLDPFLLSQHTYLEWEDSRENAEQPARPKPYREHGRYTWQLEYPAFISKHVFFHFDAHITHHLFPHLPSYLLHEIQVESDHKVNWWDWLKAAKKIPGHQLVAESGELF